MLSEDEVLKNGPPKPGKGLGFRVSGFGFRDSGFGFRDGAEETHLHSWGAGGIWVQDLGVRVGFGFRI